jgi:hypothetical protein
MFEYQYKVAAGEGAIVELKMRLLADKVAALQKFAHDQRLEDVETLIANHFSNALTAEEKATLAVCRQLRNKILHCDFHAARQKLDQLGVATRSAEVKKADIHGLLRNRSSRELRLSRRTPPEFLNTWRTRPSKPAVCSRGL